MKNNPVTDPQPRPSGGDVVILEALKMWIPPTNHFHAVVLDVCQRGEVGKEKYGSYLMSHNSRDATLDLYQELCDAIAYITQEILEEGLPGAVELSNDLTGLMQAAFRCRLRLVKKGVLGKGRDIDQEIIEETERVRRGEIGRRFVAREEE